MKTKLGILLICLCTLIRPSFGQLSGNTNQTKKVAILEVTNPDSDLKSGDLIMIQATLTNAVTGMPGYKGYERTDIGQILGEHNFQRTGMVSDAQIKRIGEMESAQYVLASVAARMSNGNLAITAKMLDVETAEVSQNAVVQTTMEDLEKGCLELVGKLFSKSGTYGNSGGIGYGVQVSGADYTEMVFGINMQMVWVEGCTSKQLDGYYIGKFEVTQGQWAKVMGTNPASFKKGDNYPVENVSWEDATAFCEELSRRTGKKYCLPTRDQWRYAERDGNRNSDSKYSGSSSVDVVAWYDGNSGGSTHPVGTKRDNLLGIYDMNGNVSEWCRDYESGSKYRPYFGGDWTKSAGLCTLGFDSPFYDRSSNIGFRVVCEP